MPQMAPLSWLNLFIYFIIVFLILNSLNYFYFNKTASNQEKKNMKMMKKNSWKW
uniref:ATP synthase F0 subunit 8 n=1 Tax=Cephalomalthinus imparicornis TaxID=3112884 RepID=UPI003001E58D|nr:ATP synthase F0 subunit 8 [Fissocantharis imparicornis]